MKNNVVGFKNTLKVDEVDLALFIMSMEQLSIANEQAINLQILINKRASIANTQLKRMAEKASINLDNYSLNTGTGEFELKAPKKK